MAAAIGVRVANLDWPENHCAVTPRQSVGNDETGQNHASGSLLSDAQLGLALSVGTVAEPAVSSATHRHRALVLRLD